MKDRIIVIIIVYFLSTAGFLGFITYEPEVVSAGNTIFVGSGPGNDTNSIPGGIFLANPGDTVFVYSGVYNEDIYINKSIDLIGEDKNTTIVNGGGFGFQVWIDDTEWVNVTGFTLTNGMVGFFIQSSSNITIWDNTVYNQNKIGGSWGHGFFFSGTPYSDNKIIGNDVYDNEGNGIHLEDQTSHDEFIFWDNIIANNTVYNNTGNGIATSQGSGNFIINNIVHHNGLGSINPKGGIYLSYSSNNVVMSNIVFNNEAGIVLPYSAPGLSLNNNTITRNIVFNNENGIRLGMATDNTFIDNSIFDNTNNVFMERQSAGNKFINCSLINSTYDDFNLTEDSHALLLNTTFNKTKVYFGDTLSTLSVNWYMHVNVRYYNESPANGSNIWVNDTYGSNIVNDSVNSQGWKKWIVTNEYIEQDLNGDHVGEKIFYYTPHHVAVTDGFYWGYADPVMNISKVVTIYLGEPPPLLPPTNLTTKTVNNGNYVELEWDPPPSPTLNHYLIYRADSATDFDFSVPYKSSISWSDPLNTTWIDPDPSVTAVDDDFYYIVRAANANESDVSSTSNTAGVWTKTFQPGISTFSLPLEPFVKKDAEYYCQDMNATYIKWMNKTSHTWVQHDKGISGNNSMIEVGEGYEIGFLGKSIQTRYTFTGIPGAMISYDNDTGFLGFDPNTEAKNLTASVEPNGNVTLNWQEPASMSSGDWYEVYYSHTRDGFFKTLGSDYDLACSPLGFGNDTTTITNLGADNPGARLYFMVVPFNSLGVRGASTYSIGIWTEEFLAQYDTLGIPLKLDSNKNADWYCDNIPETVGMNYFVNSQQRWSWHSTLMPQGAFDPLLMIGEGYQISTSSATKFTFIGR
jgi:parallel beta-helix repeat protein